MNTLNYYITTHFITSNKDYNSYCNFHSVYQTYPNSIKYRWCSNVYSAPNLIVALLTVRNTGRLYCISK